MKRNKFSKKSLCIIAASAMIVVIAAVGVTIAYLTDKSSEVKNTFTPSKVETQIDENFDGAVKKDVRVKNNSDIDAYIRAKIVINWVKEDNSNEVLPAKSGDYTLEMGDLSKWEKIGDIYYYKEKVAPNASTDILIKSCKPNVKKDGYILNVTILAEGIQAEPDTAIKEAWKIDPNTWQEVK